MSVSDDFRRVPGPLGLASWQKKYPSTEYVGPHAEVTLDSVLDIQKEFAERRRAMVDTLAAIFGIRPELLARITISDIGEAERRIAKELLYTQLYGGIASPMGPKPVAFSKPKATQPQSAVAEAPLCMECGASWTCEHKSSQPRRKRWRPAK